ncbi:MAG: putative zinc-binding protein [Rhodocyclaceae bacterium]
MSERPIVYSCSGCSSAAQLANHVALRLDREGLADMSCIAGVGGHVAPLVHLARSGRPLIALDGCVLACVRETLAQHGLAPAVQIRLDEFGVRKLKKTDFDPAQAADLYPRLLGRLAAVLRPDEAETG